MVRDTLGEEAIIVATGEDRGGHGGVRVTAAIEPAFEIGRDGVAGASDWLQYDREHDTNNVAEELTDIMLRHNVPEDVMDHIVSCASVMGYDEPGIALIAALEQLFSFRPLPDKTNKKPIIMVGTPGAGKTLAVAKLAARSVISGLNVGVISMDTIRAGGMEQLKAFTDLMQINLRQAQDIIALEEHTEDLLETCDQVIIDTAGINPFEKQDIKYIARAIGQVSARGIMVMPAGMDSEESGEIARALATIGVSDILPTRVDMVRRLGSLLAAAHYGGLAFSDVSNTPKVAEGLAPITPKTLSRLLMPGAFSNHISDNATEHTAKTGTRQ